MSLSIKLTTRHINASLSTVTLRIYFVLLKDRFSRKYATVVIGYYVTIVLIYADDLVLILVSKAGQQKCLDD